MDTDLFDIIRRVRQNHAAEHATVHLLSARGLTGRLVGRSDWRGFWLYGPVDTEVVGAAVREGLARLQGGQGELAIHPRCGTNLAATALVTATATMAVAQIPWRSRGQQFLRVGAALLAALAVAPTVGLLAQRHLTTTADLHGVRLRAIHREQHGALTIHRVILTRE
jgi:hypothetical protein